MYELTLSKNLTAREYLAHRYEACELPTLPLVDEDFVSKWEMWLDASKRTVPSSVNDILSDAAVSLWLEKTPAGKIPVLYTRSRTSFERAICLLSPSASTNEIPSSVNAFTIKARHPDLCGHRIILINKSGYSALSGSEIGIKEEKWLEKSMKLRLNHEICHYFSLRVLGGMKNHALDEIAADCFGQLAVFGSFNESLQKRFFGIDETLSNKSVISNSRFSFYIRKLKDDSVHEVIEETKAALSGLNNYLLKNPAMTRETNRPRLIIKILSTGVRGMRDL